RSNNAPAAATVDQRVGGASGPGFRGGECAAAAGERFVAGRRRNARGETANGASPRSWVYLRRDPYDLWAARGRARGLCREGSTGADATASRCARVEARRRSPAYRALLRSPREQCGGILVRARRQAQAIGPRGRMLGVRGVA